MTAGEILLFSGNRFVATWMTPIMWTGYIALVDNIVYKRTGTSMITVSRWKFTIILLLSILSWLIFEGYNLLIQNWHYINLPDTLWVRNLGYAWAFATITPCLLLTADLLKSFKIFENTRTRQIRTSKNLLIALISVGAALSFYPLLFPNEYLFPLVWAGYIFLIDPVNYLLGGKSLLSDLNKGRIAMTLQLLLAGFICGVLWEFWNYWAVTKWIYTVPFLPELKIFEMPVLGYIGFPPFAVECYVIYQLFKTILKKLNLNLRYE